MQLLSPEESQSKYISAVPSGAIFTTYIVCGLRQHIKIGTANAPLQCDQGRPICNRCVHLGLPCAYMSDDAGATPTMALKNENEALQRRLRGHTEYLEAIQNASEDEAFDMIRHLRSTDIATALALHSQSKVSAISQSSEVPSARMIASSADSEFDVDLASTSYSDLMSLNLSSVAPASLNRRPSSPTNKPASSPEHIALCDARLEGLAVKYWTQIPIDDRLAAQAISHLLVSEHPVLGFLDTNLLLNDVVNQALFYCSSFLFHVVMALACVCSQNPISEESAFDLFSNHIAWWFSA